MAVLAGNDPRIAKWLSRDGIPVRESRRVVIDASVDSAVMVYIEKYATEKLLETPDPFPGAQKLIAGRAFLERLKAQGVISREATQVVLDIRPEGDIIILELRDGVRAQIENGFVIIDGRTARSSQSNG